jgi:hypothetical protein
MVRPERGEGGLPSVVSAIAQWAKREALAKEGRFLLDESHGREVGRPTKDKN